MLLDIRTKTNTRNRFKPGRVLVLQCDACNTQFERPFGRLKDQQTHACSRKCHGLLERKGAVRDELKRRTSMEHYGVDHPRKSAGVEEQRKSTCLERYGVEYTLQSESVRERIRQTCLKRYGVENPFQANEVKAKITNTLLKNHGVEHALQSRAISSKVDWHAAWQKQHATKKANGTYKKSSAEERFGERLSTLGNVERQVVIEHDSGAWSIDFKVNDTYVQFDGVYWHGLDRSIDTIRSSMSKRDVQIARKYDDDRKQDAWFATRSLRLLRITDRQANDPCFSDDHLKKLLGFSYDDSGNRSSSS